MAGRLYKRGRIWWAWYYDRDGRRVQRSTRCLDKRAATEVLRRWERGEQAPGGPASHAPQTVRDACEALLGEPNVTAGTQHMREVKAGHLARLLGGKRLAVLTTDDVRAYCATRHDEEGAAPGTVAKELSTLSQALRVAGERGWWRGDARTLLPRWRTGYTPRDLWLTRDQVAALCGQLEPHRALWAEVADLRATLEEVRDMDPVEAALDYTWASRHAEAALKRCALDERIEGWCRRWIWTRRSC